MTAILGLSAFYHDAAACLLVDGEIVAAAQEERFTRVKHDASFPARAVAYCLAEAGLSPDRLDFVAFYDKPLRKFVRLLETYVDVAPRGLASFLTSMPVWLKRKLWMPDLIREELARLDGAETDREARRRGRTYPFRVLFGDHHESHAASAFYPSPFESAAVLTVDGVGEWSTTAIGVGSGADLRMLEELRFPHSLGLLYTAFTYFTGFRPNSGEYKVMGLAPYGEPRYVPEIRQRLFDLAEDGSFRLDTRYFGFLSGLRMTNRRFARLFGGSERVPESEITRRELDLARSIQEVTEEAVLRLGRRAHQITGESRLCLAGGVALNCVANGRLLREGPFEELWVQPAAGDAGGALGVALAVWHRYLERPRRSAESEGRWRPAAGRPPGEAPYLDGMKGALLGPAFAEGEIERFLTSAGASYRRVARSELPRRIAQALAAGRVVALHQGRMEFGPRALGARSILADPRSPAMQSELNLRIKFREGFRPFAPVVPLERVTEYFELERESPYMLLVAPVRRERLRALTPEEGALEGLEKRRVARSDIPAVTHVDGSARIQTVRREVHPLLWETLEAFRELTGCAVLVNTSFNVRGEPIVCSPEDSYRCFRKTGIDALALEGFWLEREERAGRFELPEGGPVGLD